MLILVLAVIFSLSVSFFCSLMEACLLSLSNANIAEIGQKSPKTANIWKQFKLDIQKPIAVILICNTLAHTIGAAVSGAKFAELFGVGWIWAFSLGYSLIMIMYTEILPKTLGVRYNILLAKISALPLFAIVKFFNPFIFLIELANSPFTKKIKKEKYSVSNEISTLASAAAVENTLSQEQASLISKSLQMSTSTARDIMVEKDHIVFLDESMSLTDAFLASHVHRHTRYPLLASDKPDTILGYVNFKDLVTILHTASEDPTLKNICRPIMFLPETLHVNTILRRMTREYQHMGIVQNSKSNTIGLVTLEDVIESLVGEIEDEFDRPPEMMVMLSENRWRIGGAVPISQISEKAFSELPRSEQTIDELVKSYFKGMEPKEFFGFEFHGIQIRVRRVARGYVYDVIAERIKRFPEKTAEVRL